MPIQIGAKAHNVTDPTGLLSDCHRRVEMFLGSLEAVAKAIDRPATEETNRALESALRYFAQAAPKHTADEEESLFPSARPSKRRAKHPALSDSSNTVLFFAYSNKTLLSSGRSNSRSTHTRDASPAPVPVPLELARW